MFLLVKELKELRRFRLGHDSVRRTQLRTWWDKLSEQGPSLGYFPNASKTWIVVKPEHLDAATQEFANSGINVTSCGRPYLGAAIGSEEYCNKFVRSKIEEWSANISTLSDIAKTQPHAAYSAFTHGLASKWTYLCRVQPSITESLKPIDNLLRAELIPALTNRPPPSHQESVLFDLPARHGGLGIRLPSLHADREHQSSKLITKPLSNLILQQSTEYDYNTLCEQRQKRAELTRINRQGIQSEASVINQQLPLELQRAMDLASQKGSSSWLTTLPLAEHGFALHRAAFHDALALRYGWTPSNMPFTCVCGKHFSVEHALSCARGGFPTIRHNEIRDTTAKLLSEVCHDVCLEPDLQPVAPSQLDGATANRQDGARLDISANGVWGGKV